MAEPTSTTAGTLLGIKYLTAAAGFLGAVFSLSFLAPMGIGARMAAVGTGTASAAFLAPAVADYMTWSVKSEYALAYGIGLLAMNIIPAVESLARRVPADLYDMVRRDKRGGDQ